MNTYCQASDDVLVSLYENGDDQAFDVLLERYQQKVYNYILCMVCDEDRANDMFQEVFFKAITRIRSHRYVESGHFGSWLMRIAHNLAIDSFRQDKNMQMVSGDEEHAPYFNDPSLSEGSIESQLLTDQTFADLREMVRRLPEPQREVVRLRFYEGMSFKEIAAATNCSINTALGRMRYAVLNLRKMSVGRDMTIAVA